MSRVIDVWGNDRAKAVVLDCGLKVLKDDVVRADGAVGIYLKVWRPKAIKPYANYRFANVAQRDEYLNTQVALFKDRQARQMLRKLERQGVGVAGSDDAVKVGDIFHSSWGYDQTNNDFYQVVAKSGRSVIVRKIGSAVADGSSASWDSNRVLASKDSFLADEKPLKKLVQFSGGSPYIRIASYASASLWDGKSCYNSWGH